MYPSIPPNKLFSHKLFTSSQPEENKDTKTDIKFKIFDCDRLEEDIKKYNINDKIMIERLYTVCKK